MKISRLQSVNQWLLPFTPFPPLAALAKRFNCWSSFPASFELTNEMATNSRLAMMILKNFIWKEIILELIIVISKIKYLYMKYELEQLLYYYRTKSIRGFCFLFLLKKISKNLFCLSKRLYRNQNISLKLLIQLHFVKYTMSTKVTVGKAHMPPSLKNTYFGQQISKMFCNLPIPPPKKATKLVPH